MIAQPEDLELTVLVMAAKDASNMYSMEEQLRHSVINDGVSRTAMEVFELLPDDERQCAVCQTTCFLSAVRCPCIPNKLTCLHHYKQLCPCPVTDKTLRFRYNLHELKDLILSSQERASLYCEWASRVDQLLDGYNLPKQDITLMKQLLADGDTKRFHNCDQYRDLMSSFKDASLILTSIEEALRPKNRTKLVTASDLKQIIDNIESLPCLLPESVEFKGYVQHIVSFQKEIASTLTDVHNNSSLNMEVIDVLMDLLRRGECLTVEIPQLDDLRNVIEQLMWAQDTESLLSSGKIVHYDHLKSLFKKGQQLSQSKAVESLLIKLKALLCKIHEWEQKIKSALKDKPSHPISLYEEFLKESSQISVAIPLVEVITTLVTRAKEWNNRAQSLQVNDKHPHYDALKGLLSDARSLSVELEQLPQVESRYSAAKAWVDRASRTFSKKNSIHSLLEILLPRNPSINSFAANSKSNKKRTEDEFFVQTSPLSVAEGDRFKEMDIIHNLEKEEKLYIRKVRKSNFDKQLQDEKSSSSLPVLYCQCRKPESGYMLQCEVCNEWYHASCLHIPKSKLNPDNDNNKDVRFICGSCLRSRRPRLDNIVSLLISLQKVPVAISEGTALHCLAERAIAWQKNARELVASARPIVEEARSQQLRIYDITNKIFKWKQETLLEYKGIHHTELNNQADSVLKHYESQLLKEKSKYAGLTGDMRKNVESTLLDGDLLEVTTDETTQLWQTLQTDSDCLSYFALTEEETLKAPLPKLSSQAKKATLMLEEVEQTSPHNSSPQTKKKKNSDNNSSEAKEKSSDSTAVKRKKTTKSSDNKHSTSTATTTKSIKREPTSDTEDMDESTLNEDAICSSPHCIRPMANQISWVQCDVCQQWFHLLCVGLTTESVEKIDIYNCSICKQKCISERKALINNALSKKNTRVYASIVPTTSTASTSRTESS
jgi:histone demethylase JARID1